MIHENFSDETLAALLWCERSNEKVIVCGSRYFGDAVKSSDFDLVTDSTFLRSVMPLKTEWKRSFADENGYLDLNTEAIFERGNVHLIFPKSLPARLVAREHIREGGLNRHDSRVWDAFYAEKFPFLLQ